jgi:hypothetical protein
VVTALDSVYGWSETVTGTGVIFIICSPLAASINQPWLLDDFLHQTHCSWAARVLRRTSTHDVADARGRLAEGG